MKKNNKVVKDFGGNTNLKAVINLYEALSKQLNII